MCFTYVLCHDLHFMLMFSGHLLKHLFKGGQGLTRLFSNKIINVTQGLPSFLSRLLTSEFTLFQNSSLLIHVLQFVNCWWTVSKFKKERIKKWLCGVHILGILLKTRI